MTQIPMDYWYPDLSPPYPTPAFLQNLLSPESQLTATDRATVVQHSLNRACLFADLSLLTFILRDPLTHPHVNLGVVDEDGLGLVSQTIFGFGTESEKDVEREECIRLLISDGADMIAGDAAGWTALHYAAVLSPPTLVSYLITHGSDPLKLTLKGLTPLDTITAQELVPGRETVALLLEEAMRERGWKGTSLDRKREERRKRHDDRVRMLRERREEWNVIGRTLDIGELWWESSIRGPRPDEEELDTDDEDDNDEVGDEYPSDETYTPPKDYTNMLVFSLYSLPAIFHSVINNAQPVLYPISKRSAPANALYLLARFACIECDSTWLEELLAGAADRIEEVIYAKPNDLSFLAFWLYNVTLLLHLLRCDRDVVEMCEEISIHSLLEDVINAIFVFIIRVAEKRIDTLIDPALLDHSPLSSEFESVQFESEWSFLRSLTTPKKKVPASPLKQSGHLAGTPPTSFAQSSSSASASSSRPPSRPSSPSPTSISKSTSTTKAFNSIRNKFGSVSSSTSSSLHPSLSNVFRPPSPPPPPVPTTPSITPTSVTSLLQSLHTLLTLYSINPALIIQAHSQILYWTACELFNRLLTRKKYLCRSRAVQVGMNLSIVEEWIGDAGLPRGVGSHFDCVRELLGWLQCLSSIDQFTSLVDTIQTMRTLNPLQMRRAVRDYRFEVNEGRMTEECSQYLAQLQKDWERQRVKLGVEAIRKEQLGDRQRDRDGSVTSGMSGNASPSPVNGDVSNDSIPVSNPSEIAKERLQQERDEAQLQIDSLFDREQHKSDWIGPRAPEVLGELMDSRYMLPLVLPSDPTLLCARPGLGGGASSKHHRKRDSDEIIGRNGRARSISPASSIASGTRGAVLEWRKRGEKVREIDPELVEWVDGDIKYRLGMGWLMMMKAELEKDEQKELIPASVSFADQQTTPSVFLSGDAETAPSGDMFTMPPPSPGFLQPESDFDLAMMARRRRSRHGRESTADTIASPEDEEETVMTPTKAR